MRHYGHIPFIKRRERYCRYSSVSKESLQIFARMTTIRYPKHKYVIMIHSDKCDQVPFAKMHFREEVLCLWGEGDMLVGLGMIGILIGLF